MKNLNEIYHSVNWGDPLQMNVQYMAGQLWKELLEEFSQTVQQSSGYFAFAAGVSQADTPAPGMADIVSGAMILGGLLVCAVISTYDTMSLPDIAIPKKRKKSKDKAIPKIEVKDDLFPIPDFKICTTYYHVTTIAAAVAIMATGIMTGSKWESGYVYAWKSKPCEYAIKHSGAHMGVIISFKTNASFVNDTGIKNLVAITYGTVVSVRPGLIFVQDVQIVG